MLRSAIAALVLGVAATAQCSTRTAIRFGSVTSQNLSFCTSNVASFSVGG